MKPLFNILILSIFLSVAIANVSAQTNNGKFTLAGLAADSATRSPLPYISVSLKNDKNIVVKAMPANADGIFKFTDVAAGKYLLLISSFDHFPKTITAELKEGDVALKELGTIYLSPSVKKLKEVQITGTRPLIRQEIDRISYDLQADPESKGSNVIGMMRKIPYLSVDGNDNILLKGKDDYKIFINGRPSSMLERDPKAILRSMPASSIERIEVITNPPSKYDAEGVGGIINIITTKNITNGYNASVNVSERFPVGGPGMGGSINYKQDKFGLSAFGGASLNNAPQTSNFKTLQGTTNTNLLSQSGISNSDSRNGYIGTELSYEIDSLNLVSGSLNMNGGLTKGYNGQFSLLNNLTSVLEGYDLNNNSTTDGKGWDAAVNYQLGFRKNKNQLLTFSYRTYKFENILNSDQIISNRVNYITPDYKQFNASNSGEQTFQLDYVQPLKNVNMEVGIKAIFRDNDGDFLYSAFNSGSGSFVDDPTRSNLYTNRQKIYGAYNTYQFKIKSWGFKAGFRAEQTIIDADFISNASAVNQNYTNILATVAISKKLNDFNSMTFGFMQRVRRAGINKLNPFVDRSNPNFESSGNPNLRPSIMNTIQAGYSGFKKPSVNLSLDYSFARGLYIPISTFNPATQVTRTTFENVGDANRLGFDFNVNYPVTKKLNVSLNGNAEFISLLALTNGMMTRTNVHMHRVFISSGYNFNKGWRVNANMNYVSRNVTTLQGRADPYVSYSTGLNKDIVKDKLSFSANINNPFTKYRENRSVTRSPDFIQTNLNNEYFRSFSMTMNYRFGKLKESIKKSRRGIKNDDVSN